MGADLIVKITSELNTRSRFTKMTDEEFLMGLKSDVLKALQTYGLHVGMHQAANDAKISGTIKGAQIFNTVSWSTKETFLSALARVLDQSGGGSLYRVKSRKDIKKPDGFELGSIQKNDAASKLKEWRNTILSHKDGSLSASDNAAKIEMHIFEDYESLLKQTFIMIFDLCWANNELLLIENNETKCSSKLFDSELVSSKKDGKDLVNALFLNSMPS